MTIPTYTTAADPVIREWMNVFPRQVRAWRFATRVCQGRFSDRYLAMSRTQYVGHETGGIPLRLHHLILLAHSGFGVSEFFRRIEAGEPPEAVLNEIEAQIAELGPPSPQAYVDRGGPKKARATGQRRKKVNAA